MSFDLNTITRENIRKLTPYSSARSEFSGVAQVFLDANENSFGSPLTKWYNRYPDPLQWELKKKNFHHQACSSGADPVRQRK